MTIQVTGVMVTPMNQPIAGAEIRIRAVENGDTLHRLNDSVTTGSGGEYSFSLLNGKYRVDVKQDNKYSPTSYVEVTSGTITPLDLETLIKDYGFCKPIAPVCP